MSTKMKNMFIVSIMIISALVLLLTIPQGNAATEQRNTRAADIGKSPGREDENPNPTSSDASNAAATVKKKSFEAEMDQSVINTNAEFSDPVNSVRGKIPDGWTLISAPRWGVSQTTLGFQIKDNPLVTANLYYRIFEKPETKTAEEIKGWLI